MLRASATKAKTPKVEFVGHDSWLVSLFVENHLADWHLVDKRDRDVESHSLIHRPSMKLDRVDQTLCRPNVCRFSVGRPNDFRPNDVEPVDADADADPVINLLSGHTTTKIRKSRKRECCWDLWPTCLASLAKKISSISVTTFCLTCKIKRWSWHYPWSNPGSC